MRKRGRFGSRLYVTIAAALIAAFGLLDIVAGRSALAQFPTGDTGNWVGTFKSKHTCTQGSFSTEKHATADFTLARDGRGNLTGTLTGSDTERKTIGPPCTWVHFTPTTFSAKLIGFYRPERDSFSVQATAGQSNPGRFTISCGGSDSTVDKETIFNVHEHGFFEDAFRDLRGRPDGSRASTGEWTHSDGGMMCTTNYSLTLRQRTVSEVVPRG